MKKYALIIFLINKIFTQDSDWGVNDQVELLTDMSETCVENLETDVYLPFGMGVADTNVIIVSDNDLYPNCVITFHSVGVNEGVYLLVVVEFPDHTEGPRNACQDDGSTVLIQDMNKVNIDVCTEVNGMQFGYYNTPTYSMLSNSSNVSVIIESKSLFETLKITVTSARKLNQYEKCDELSEVPCLVSNASVCISKELQCDENINCGSPTLNDEDVRICDEARYNRLWLVVLCGTIMIMIVVFFLIHLLRTCLPSVPDSFFIFNEDEDNTLILSTKYTAPPESMRQTLKRQPLLLDTSSSFKFKTIPINEKISIPIFTPSDVENKEKISLPSSDMEIELESHLYKSDIKKQVDEIINTLPIKDEPELHKSDIKKQVENIVDNLPINDDEFTPAKSSVKKPRFEEANFINIMDRIDLPTEVPKHHQKAKKHSIPSKPKKSSIHHTSETEKRDHSPTFSLKK